MIVEGIPVGRLPSERGTGRLLHSGCAAACPATYLDSVASLCSSCTLTHVSENPSEIYISSADS